MKNKIFILCIAAGARVAVVNQFTI